MKDNTGEGAMRWLNRCRELSDAANAVHGVGDKSLQPIYLMLAGYAIEVGLKAVYALEMNERPNTYRHGIHRLAKDLNIPLSCLEENYLKAIEEYVLWAGRYPETMKHEPREYRKFSNKVDEAFFEKGRLGESELTVMIPSTVDKKLVVEGMITKIVERFNDSYGKKFSIG